MDLISQSENELLAHESAIEAAVISVDHERWQERPVAYIVTKNEVGEDDLREHPLKEVPRWWLPDRFVFSEEIPRTSTGKYNKKVIRTSFNNEYGTLPIETNSDHPDHDQDRA
ncbi:hypothetical protein ACFQPA_15665 [Halomarina halobia]|uniref:AMP-binding enzyme n=1 Tax=Halomarina halobia TaxID=3033386 RepID=UPI0023E89BFA|nr:hypothetical protein [Halomarina sp. PSR21]